MLGRWELAIQILLYLAKYSTTVARITLKGKENIKICFLKLGYFKSKYTDGIIR
jgi:hypothetical protein